MPTPMIESKRDVICDCGEVIELQIVWSDDHKVANQAFRVLDKDTFQPKGPWQGVALDTNKIFCPGCGLRVIEWEAVYVP
jgi:hypothetical protein